MEDSFQEDGDASISYQQEWIKYMLFIQLLLLVGFIEATFLRGCTP